MTIIISRRNKDINIKNLSPGLTVKNYKELCELLEIKTTTGGAKKNQLKEMESYFNYNKEGNSFKINKIYDNPIITIDQLKQTKYIKQLSNIIIEYLYSSNELEQIPLFKLLNVLGITNSNYEDVNRYRKEYSQLNNIHLASIYYFYSNTKMQFKRIVESCLNNLKRRRILNWNICCMIIDSNNKTIYKADKEMESMIIDTEYMALKELNKSNMFELMKDKRALKKFNELVNLETGGLNYYYAYDLVIGNIALKSEYTSIKEAKQELNNLMIEKTGNTFKNDKFKYYKNDYDILIDSLININNVDQELLDKLKKQRIDNKGNYKRLKKSMNSCIDTYANKDILKDEENITW